MIVMVTAFAARIHGKPLVLQPHGTLPHVVSSIWLKRLFDGLFMGWLLAGAHAVVALQETEERQIAKSGGAAEKVHRVPNGLDTEGYRAEDYQGRFRAKLRIPSQTTIILFLGRLNRKKGADMLLEAFARLPESIQSSAQLVVAGPDDGQLAELKKITARLGLNDQVLFPGLLEGDDVLAAYADADLFVLPCRGDTFPMTILEACRAGKPMVVSETCEISDLLAGEAGEVVPVDPAGLAAGIQRIVTDRRLYEHYQSGTQRLMESEFSISAVVDRLEVIYHSVLEAASGA
jgi:glycosyltransferase involved in cell wall biosynthesis